MERNSSNSECVFIENKSFCMLVDGAPLALIDLDLIRPLVIIYH